MFRTHFQSIIYLALLLAGLALAREARSADGYFFEGESLSRPKVDFRQFDGSNPLEFPAQPGLDLQKGGTIEFTIRRTWDAPLFNADPAKNQRFCILSNGVSTLTRKATIEVKEGFDLVDKEVDQPYQVVRWAVFLNERTLYVQLGEEVKSVNFVQLLPAGVSELQLATDYHVALTFKPGTGNQFTATAFLDGKKGQPLPQLAWSAAPAGALRVGSLDGKLFNLIGDLGGVRIWSKAYDIAVLDKLRGYRTQHAERGIRCPEPTEAQVFDRADVGELLAYSDFLGDEEVRKRPHRLVFPHFLQGNWIAEATPAPTDATPLPGLDSAFGNVNATPIYTCVIRSPQWVYLYRDGILIGYLSNVNDSWSFESVADSDKARVTYGDDRLTITFTQVGSSVQPTPQMTAQLQAAQQFVERATKARDDAKTAHANLQRSNPFAFGELIRLLNQVTKTEFELLGAKTQLLAANAGFQDGLRRMAEDLKAQRLTWPLQVGTSVVLVRPRGLNPGKPINAEGWGERDRMLTYYKTNCRAYNIIYMDPVNFFRNTGSTKQIFADPVNGDFRDENGKNVPNTFHFLKNTQNTTNWRSQMVTSQEEASSMYSVNIGASIGVPDLISFSNNTSFKTTTENLRSRTSASTFAQAQYVDYKLSLDRASARLHPEFIERVRQLAASNGDDNNYRDFLQTWGTHYAYSVTYGGLLIYEQEMSQERVSQALSWGLDIESEVKVTVKKKAEGGVMAGVGTEQSSKHDLTTEYESTKVTVVGENNQFSADPRQMMVTFAQSVPIFLDLHPIYELLSPAYFDDPAIFHYVRGRLQRELGNYLNQQQNRTERQKAIEMANRNRLFSETYRVELTKAVCGDLYDGDSSGEIFGQIVSWGKVRTPNGWVDYHEIPSSPRQYPLTMWRADEGTNWNLTEHQWTNFPAPGQQAYTVRLQAEGQGASNFAISDPADFLAEIYFDIREDDPGANPSDDFGRTTIAIMAAEPTAAERQALSQKYSQILVFKPEQQEGEILLTGDGMQFRARFKYWKGADERSYQRKFQDALDRYQREVVQAARPMVGPDPKFGWPGDAPKPAGN